jgi:hypothetical protein
VLKALKARAKQKRQTTAIHAYRLLQWYAQPIRNCSDAETFLAWLRAEGLSDWSGWRCPMKTITIRLPDVEATMLFQVQKVNKAYRDLQGLLLNQIRQENAKAPRGRA